MLHDPHAARHFALIGAFSTGCCCAKLGAAGKAHNHDSAAGRLLMLMEVAFCGLFLSPRPLFPIICSCCLSLFLSLSFSL